MARDTDAQLLEAAAVRRTRLRDALLRGQLRTRQPGSDNVGRFVIGCILATVLCAGCVGWSFLQEAFVQQRREAQQRSTGTPATPPRPSATPSAPRPASVPASPTRRAAT